MDIRAHSNVGAECDRELAAFGSSLTAVVTTRRMTTATYRQSGGETTTGYCCLCADDVLCVCLLRTVTSNCNIRGRPPCERSIFGSLIASARLRPNGSGRHHPCPGWRIRIRHGHGAAVPIGERSLPPASPRCVQGSRGRVGFLTESQCTGRRGTTISTTTST